MRDWRRELQLRLEPLRLRPEREAEIVDELSQHLDDRVREMVATGASLESARLSALDELDAVGELARRLSAIEARSPYQLPPPGAPVRARWLSAIAQDVRHAVRSFRRTPGFTIAVVATLALTIGPTTALVSIGNWLLWRPAPSVSEPDRLAVLWFGDWRDSGGVSPRRISDLNLADLRRASKTMAGLEGWQESSVSVAADGASPRIVGSAHASVNYFTLLGVRPAAGRAFSEDDDHPPFGSPVTILGDRLARGIFGSPEAAVSRAITLNGRPLTVIGVMPPGFVGARPDSFVDVWVPSWTNYYVRHFGEAAMRSREGRGTSGVFYTFVARLAPGATFQALQAELDVLVPALAEQYPEDNKSFRITRARAYPGLGPDELLRDEYAVLVRNLLMVGGALLLLGCANVANLLISRGVRRSHERGVRLALGASRGRLVQQLLTESCLLSVVGAAAGVGLAVWLKELVQGLIIPAANAAGVDLTVPLDTRVLLVTLGVAIACGLVAGLAPALVGSSVRAGTASRHGARTFSAGSRVRTGLAVVQLALSLALVTNATLLVTTLRNLAAVDLGFQPAQVSYFSPELRNHGYTEARALVYDRDLLERLSADASMAGVSLSVSYPPGCGLGTRIVDPRDSETRISVCEEYVSGGYFRTLEVPILRGRTFTDAEALTPAPLAGTPVVLGQALARKLFGDVDPLGRHVTVPANTPDPAYDLVVVGVAGDVRGALPAELEMRMYTPFVHGGAFATTRVFVMVRSPLPVREIGERVRVHTQALDPALGYVAPRPLAAALERQVTDRQVFAWVLTSLGALSFLLAAIGLYGLLAQIVSERAREFGIRMAIGANRGHVIRLVVRLAAWVGVLGGTAGLALAAFGSQLVEAQLVGVSRFDPTLYVASAGLLALVILAACLIPALRAAKVDPVQVLRAE
jgi:predicted permease